jgi:murein DD-endopeptidase MepM/ murein hydrolase activator NlpD
MVKVRHKHKKKHRRKPEPRIRVVPSAENEARISLEVAKAGAVLRALTPDNMLVSPYLVSAIYYHDGLLDSFNENKPDADPADRIVAHIVRGFGTRTKASYIDMLRQCCACSFSELGPGCFLKPVDYALLAHGRGIHPYAIDLFVPEGTPVRSATRGLVVIAESGWMPNQYFSTSTVRGGNSVIVFDPDRTRFLRYAHLEKACVTAGTFVENGDTIGSVGHTGFNASRKGHGRHLHFEINEYAKGIVAALPNEELEALLEATSGMGRE